jgi:transketolase
MLNLSKIDQLEARALRVREHIIKLATDGGCFLGASLSCTDLVVYLYSHFLNISLETLDDPQRDYLFLSKGHDVPALYGTFVELGWLPETRLQNHLKSHDSIYWHPNRTVPGIEFHAGSLGHLLPVAAGVAYDCKLRQQANRVVVITGDGELNEGSNWEALLVAQAYRLDNCSSSWTATPSRPTSRPKKLIPLEPLADKFRAFGCAVQTVDGHDFGAIDDRFAGVATTRPASPPCSSPRRCAARGCPPSRPAPTAGSATSAPPKSTTCWQNCTARPRPPCIPRL